MSKSNNAEEDQLCSITTAQVRAIGEHYVMSRLLAEGYIVGLAPENTRAVDLIAMTEDGKGNIQIQVKTRTCGKSFDEGWHMSEKHERITNPSLYYVFVSLPKRWTDKIQPETFIIPSLKVASILEKSHKDWKSTPGA